MKKLKLFLFILVSGLWLNVTAGQESGKTILISPGLKCAPVKQHLENPELNSSVDISYPQISGARLSPGAQHFNQVVQKIVQDEVEQFDSSLQQTVSDRQNSSVKRDAEKSYFQAVYEMDKLHFGKSSPTILTVRWSIEAMQAGLAHPYHLHRSLNFNLEANKVIALHELFAPRSAYLNVLSKYTRAALNKSLSTKTMIEQGAAPKKENYQVWNLQTDGILFTFDEGRVAPYAEGASEVKIPFSALGKAVSWRFLK